MNEFQYVGTELDLFAQAINWKTYWSSRVRPYLAGDVLEVGAGIGANTPLLITDKASSWTCLEPDAALAERMSASFRARRDLERCEIVVGTTQAIDGGRKFDSILYIDVLEHIEDDLAEVAAAVRLLRDGGRVIVLAPAHQSLFSPFDRKIGHVRRYDKGMLARCVPSECRVERLDYLDAVGLAASLGNRLFLRQADPNLNQILFWDRCLVRLSRLIDPITFHLLGKSVLGVWTKA